MRIPLYGADLLSRGELGLVLLALAYVWDRHGVTGGPSGGVHFFEDALPIEGEVAGAPTAMALFWAKEDAIGFSVGGIRRRGGADPAHAWIVYAAHEAMHRAQHCRGDILLPNIQMGLADYLDEPQEAEAWREGVRALAALCPGAHGSVVVGECSYACPLDVPAADVRQLASQIEVECMPGEAGYVERRGAA